MSKLEIFGDLLIAGPIIGATCGLLSVYVVLRRMALISEGVSHAGYGGIGLAILLGQSIPFFYDTFGRVFVTSVFCISTAFLIGYVTRRKRVSEDSAIGIFLVATVAIGQLLISIRNTLPLVPGQVKAINVEGLLFGNIVAIDRIDVYTLITLMVLVFGTVGALYYQFLYTTLDEEMARINGVNTRLVNTLLLMMISLVIVLCVRMVGFLMITALTIIPGATANLLSRRFVGVLVLSLLIGTLGTSAATCLAIFPPFNDYSPGPMVVLTLFAIFVIVWLFRQFVKPKVIAIDAAPPPAHTDPSSFGSGHTH